jgi:hypothetical protein
LMLALSAPASAGVIASTSFEYPQFDVVPAGGIQYGPYGDYYSNPDQYTSPSNPAFTFSGYSGILSNSNRSSSYGVLPDYPTYYQVLPATPFGTQAGFLQALSSNPSIDWTVGGLTPGDKYRLSFWDAGGTGPYVGVDPIDLALTGATTSFSTNFIPVAGTYEYNSLTFTANAPSVTIGFNGYSSGANLLSGIDNIQVSSVPEPATWSMTLAGCFVLGAMLRRRRMALAS